MTSKEKILEAIKQNPNASYMDLAKACGMSKTNVFHHVQGLIKQGIVEKINILAVHETQPKD